MISVYLNMKIYKDKMQMRIHCIHIEVHLFSESITFFLNFLCILTSYVKIKFDESTKKKIV